MRIKKKLAVWHPSYLVGNALEDGGDIRGAIRAYKKAAKDGDSSSQNVLGNLLDELGKSKDAVYWYKRAIRSGNYTGAYNLGVHYGNLCQSRWQIHWLRAAEKMGCEGVAEDTFDRGIDLEDQGDLKKAMTYFRAAAEFGHTGAQSNLGVILETKCNPAQIKDAIYWYKRAAKGGNALGASNLALHYRDNGKPRSRLRWLRMAARLGDTNASKEICKLERQLEQQSRRV